MKILYVDESGTAELASQPNHFVLLGLMIDAEEWKELDSKIENLKGKYDLRGVEVHTAWIARRYVEQMKVAGFDGLSREKRRSEAEIQIRKRAGIVGVDGKKNRIRAYRREVAAIRPYIHLSFDERHVFLKELAEEIGSWAEARLFAEAISKKDFANTTMSPYEMAFEQVLTRYQAYLERMRASGIVVHDNNTTVAPRLTRLARDYHKVGTLYRRIRNIVETPLFVDSQLTSMIQMADVCVYGLRRYIESGETYIWEHVKSRVDRTGGVDVGLRHYTGKRQCECDICKAHGRKDGKNPPTRKRRYRARRPNQTKKP